MKDLCRGYILVVEEDHDLGRLFEAVLAIDGYHVTVTHHIYEAHCLLSQREPDLIIFDWSLHNAAGYVWVDELRTTAHTAHIPILLVCGMQPPRSIYEMLASAGVPIIRHHQDLVIYYFCTI